MCSNAAVFASSLLTGSSALPGFPDTAAAQSIRHPFRDLRIG